MYLKLIREIEQMYEYDVVLENKVIGNAVLRYLNNKENDTFGNIAYAIDKEYRGHHYSVEVVSLLIIEGEKIGLPYLISTVNVHNEASKRIMELCGWEMIGTFKINEFEFLKYRKEI